MKQLLLLAAVCVLPLSACVKHIEPYEPKVRNFDPGEYPQQARTSSGSLFLHGSTAFVEDERPNEVGDILVIRVDEADSASQASSTALDRSSEHSYGITGALEKLDPDLGISNLLGAKGDYNFNGGGRIQRKGHVQAILPVRVRRVLPNGDLYVEGTKVVLVGEEERHLYLSGIARSTDIRSDGSISSSRIADAEIEYTGKGDATDQQRQGWFSKFVSYIWPF